MTIMEKPLSFSDFKDLKENSNKKAADYIIRRLNEAIRRRTTIVHNWSSDRERVEILAIVGNEFKDAGWGGVIQRKNKSTDRYDLVLVPPGCICHCTETCEACKEV
jgi:hypothetical protein